jgi:type I restriction enzyme S subunit
LSGLVKGAGKDSILDADKKKALMEAATELADADKPYETDRAALLEDLDTFRMQYPVATALPPGEEQGLWDTNFVAYFLQNVLRNYQSDKAAVPGVNRNDLHDMKVRSTDAQSQERIASILFAYDDLIENNRRRMALLEEVAWQLYREWFVRLRFPGHEHTRITDGVPEGWEHQLLAKACLSDNGIQTGPFGSQLHQADYTEEGVPVVMPKDIINFRISVDDIARIPESLADSLGRHRMQEGDVAYGRCGFISRRQAGWLCGTGCLRLRPNPDMVVPRYFFDALGVPDTAGTIAARAKGATMPNLNTTIMASVPLLVPPRTLQRQYAENVEPMFEMVETLADQNQKLRTARDLLLPRLMSGEITV